MAVGDAPSLAVPAAGRYRVDPQRSTVTYSGRHMFGLGAVRATFTIASGELLVADPVAASTVVVSVDAGSFRSDKSRRDDQVRSASLLDAATYPNITFTSDGLREQGAGWLLDGALTAHGSAADVHRRTTAPSCWGNDDSQRGTRRPAGDPRPRRRWEDVVITRHGSGGLAGYVVGA